MFPTSWSNSPLRLSALRPLTFDPEYAGSYRAKDEASLGAARLGGGVGHGTRRSPSTGAVTDNPSLLRSSMDQQFERSSAFSATFSEPGGSNYATSGSNYGHAVSPALSTGCTVSPRSAPPTPSGRLNDRDKRAAPPCWTTDRP